MREKKVKTSHGRGEDICITYNQQQIACDQQKISISSIAERTSKN